MTDPAPSPLPRLPARDPRGHKVTFGTVLVVGGCAEAPRRMIGAPALAALGALRAGAGLARLAMPEPVLSAGIVLCPSATGVPLPVDDAGRMLAHGAVEAFDEQLQGTTCLVIGPGLGAGDGASALSLRAVQQEDAPVIVDADAINALAEVPDLTRDFRAAAVLTPHPGEYKRIASSLKISLDPARPDTRAAAATALAQRLGCIVVLKGAGSVVSDGQRTWVNNTGGAELAAAGSGDVLSGLIAGLVAQFVAPVGLPGRSPGRPLDLFDATRLAVHAHGLAGERWAAAHKAGAGMLATELAAEIPAVLAGLTAQ